MLLTAEDRYMFILEEEDFYNVPGKAGPKANRNLLSISKSP